MESDRRSSFLFGRIFLDEPVSTSSEIALAIPQARLGCACNVLISIKFEHRTYRQGATAPNRHRCTTGPAPEIPQSTSPFWGGLTSPRSFPLEAETILSVVAHEPHRPSAWLGAGAARALPRHPDASRALFDPMERNRRTSSLVWSHFLRRTGIHFVGKCSSAADVHGSYPAAAPHPNPLPVRTGRGNCIGWFAFPLSPHRGERAGVRGGFW